MKAHFIKLINYDYQANQKIINTIKANNYSEKALILMAHLLTASQIWLSRCQGKPTAHIVLWPQPEPDAFEQFALENYNGWITYLNAVTDAGFEQSIVYKNSSGTEFNTKVIDVLSHLINHGTHHRAQIGQQLKFAGADTLPPTDYILFTRGTF